MRPPAPVPDVAAFHAFFARLFGDGVSSAEPPDLVASLEVASLPAFTAAEV